jgi:5,10-methylenetetrahydromethanopterin reductase
VPGRLPLSAWPACLGVSLEGREALAAVPDLARAAEAGGAGTLWVASHLFLRDPVTMAQVALAATTRLRVALMAMSPYAMHPVHIAMGAAALDELHPGRVVLCLGTGAPADRAAAGIAAPQPIATLREAILLCRGLLAGETVRLEGRAFRLDGQRRLAAGPAQMPILLAASRPGMLRLAGEVADGVLLSGGSSRPYVARCLDVVGEAAAGRPIVRIGLVYAAQVPPGADRARALAPIRRRLAFVLRGAHHADNLAAAGTVLDQARLFELTQAGRWEEAMAMLDDTVVARHAALGSDAGLAAALDAYRAAGLDEVVLASLGDKAAIADALGAAGGPP